jgi:hypothetical protein
VEKSDPKTQVENRTWGTRKPKTQVENRTWGTLRVYLMSAGRRVGGSTLRELLKKKEAAIRATRPSNAMLIQPRWPVGESMARSGNRGGIG